MCVGPFAPKMPQMPAPPKRQAPPPSQKAAAPPPEYQPPEDIKDKQSDEEKLSTKKKKELQIQKQKEGVKQFGSVDPDNIPKTPEGGVNPPK